MKVNFALPCSLSALIIVTTTFPAPAVAEGKRVVGYSIQ